MRAPYSFRPSWLYHAVRDTLVLETLGEAVGCAVGGELGLVEER
jgi:hypothetical protein